MTVAGFVHCSNLSSNNCCAHSKQLQCVRPSPHPTPPTYEAPTLHTLQYKPVSEGTYPHT